LRVACWQEADGTNAQRLEQPPELVFDDIRQGTGNKKAGACIGAAGHSGTSEARQASSPWVNVVSMPEPE
jgi:hypothetical protein